MPSKRSGQPAEPTSTYAEWEAHAAALLKQRGIPAGRARQRDLRHMLITDATPEQAAEHVQALYWNTRPAFERMRNR